ncbi:hypothetical protein GCM10010275_15910 [Streptomyces litmocidini]|uniref:hypothetical protein n=1 Tax=Streptomyces litmocidini TaxID=67318 RepID=UPI00167D5B72|nr:hypothetical protein [Streptomyces litmocidini]GGU81738.1 hypothetical protein GCM10010275_15910 [Streptomyces litmocidini]
MSPAPSPHAPERPSDPALLRRAALSGLLGTVIEHDDFLLHGTRAVSDRVDRRAVVPAGAAGSVLLAFPVHAPVDARSPAPLVLGMALGQVVQPAMCAPPGPLLSEMFGTRVRCTGAPLGHQPAALIGGGATPVPAGGLLSSGDARSAPLAVLAVVCGLVTALAVRRTGETRGRDLAAEDPAAAERSRTRPTSRGAEA